MKKLFWLIFAIGFLTYLSQNLAHSTSIKTTGAGVMTAAVPPISTPVSTGNGTSAGATSTAVAVTTANIATGDTIVVCVSTRGSSITGVTDSAGNTYTQAVTIGDGNTSADIWYSANVTGFLLGGTITATSAVGGAGALSVTAKISNLTTTPLDKTATQLNGGTSPSVSSGVLAQSNEIVMGCGSVSRVPPPTYTESAGFTSVSNNSSANSIAALAGEIVSATSSVTYAPTWSAAGSGQSTVLATFKGL